MAGRIMATDPNPPGSGGGSLHPLAGGAVIGAIYRIVFNRPGDNDVFRAATVRWTDFILPVAVFVVLNLTYEIGSDRDLRSAVHASPRSAVIVIGLIGAAILLRAVIGLAVTWVLAKGLASPGRVGPGLLAYMWTQAALISPWVIVLRGGVSGHDPMWMIVLFGFVPALFLFYCAGRVMRVAFALPGLGLGILFALLGSAVSYFVDSLFAL
jgi:hypothetical protein